MTVSRKDIARLRELLSKATPRDPRVGRPINEWAAAVNEFERLVGYCNDEAWRLLPALLDAIERMDEVLSFYADPEKYSDYQDHDPGCHPDGGCVGTCGEYLSDADRDGGWRARDAWLPEGDDK
jgi:hypothetical protein